MKRPLLWWFALWALLAAADTVTPGAKIPGALATAVRPALEAERAALLAKDLPAVKAAVQQTVDVLGAWVGNPETATVYYLPIDARAFDLAHLRESWLTEVERGLKGVPWRKNPAGDPRLMEAGLREAALPLAALARMVPLVPERKSEFLDLVRAGADWLLARQATGGVFPMPAGPALHPREKVGFLMEKMLQAHPDMVIDGWIPDDRGDGGLQFDNGLCGTAMVEAWEVTRDERYLAAARRSAAWAMAQPLVPNWNYNAFSAGFLGRLARATGDEKFLAAAVEKARIGVLPGQLPGGRWVDPHNASAPYHNILLRELLEVYAALPEADPFRAELLASLRRGLDQAAGETVTHGFTGTWTADFARALALLGEDNQWRAALHICVNSAQSGQAKQLGLDTVRVLELAEK